jgi:hypothetical protein
LRKDAGISASTKSSQATPVKNNIKNARTVTPRTPQTPKTPKTATQAKILTSSSKKRKMIHGSESDDDEEKYVSAREVMALSDSPSNSRHNSVAITDRGQDGIHRQRRAASAKVAEYIKQERDAYESGEESNDRSAAEGDISDFADLDADAELGV